MGDEDAFAVAGIQLEPSELLDERPDVVRHVAAVRRSDRLRRHAERARHRVQLRGRCRPGGISRNAALASVRTAADFVARSRLNEAGRNRAVESSGDAERDARIAAFGSQAPIAARSLGFRGRTRCGSRRTLHVGRGRFEQARPSQERALDREPATPSGVPGAAHEGGIRASAGRSAWALLRKAELAHAVAESVPRRPTCCAICWPRAPGRQDGQGAGARSVVRRRR